MYRLSEQRVLRRLTRVIPVAQTQVHHDIGVTISSLDCYDHGFDINIYVWRDAMDDLVPYFSVFILFDGQEPVPGGGAGRKTVGNHRSDSPHWYFRYWHHPSPDASVDEVQIVVPTVHLAEVRPFGTMRKVNDVAGPWACTASCLWSRAAERNDTPTAAPTAFAGAWADPERVRELRTKRLTESASQNYPIYDIVLNVLYCYDPWAVGWRVDIPFGAEEYKAEADVIVPRLLDAHSAAEVQRIVCTVMGNYSGAWTSGGEECYAEIAEEIWTALRR